MLAPQGDLVWKVVSTPEYLNHFRSGFTYTYYTYFQCGFLYMVWTVKNNFDADPFNLDQKAARWVVSIWV